MAPATALLPPVLHTKRKLWRLDLSMGDFEVFCLAGATCCIDGDEIWHGGVD